MMALVLFDNSKLFRDIAQSKSISRGASQNGISQSAASQHLQELEKKLGMSLLDRTTRPLALTAAGRLYFDLCRDVLRREEEFQAALDELKARVEGAVRVASIYSIGLSEMSRLQEEFSRRFPNAQLHVEDLSIRRELDRFFREQSIEIHLAMQFDNIQMIKEAVALGSGISILPARTLLAEVEQGRLVAIPLHAPDLVRPVGIVHRKRKRFNRAAQSFLELLQEAPDRVTVG